MGITGAIFFKIEPKTVRRDSADAILKRFQHQVLSTGEKPTINMGQFRMAQPIAWCRLLISLASVAEYGGQLHSELFRVYSIFTKFSSDLHCYVAQSKRELNLEDRLNCFKLGK